MSPHLDPARFDALAGADRRAMVDHLRACPACRQAAAAADPTILFALLDRAPVPERVLQQVTTGVALRIAATARPGGVRAGAVAAMIALALLCGYATVQNVVPQAPHALAGRELPSADHPRAAVDVRAAEAVSSVVDFTVGETQVVMVYNGDLHL